MPIPIHAVLSVFVSLCLMPSSARANLASMMLRQRVLIQYIRDFCDDCDHAARQPKLDFFPALDSGRPPYRRRDNELSFLIAKVMGSSFPR
jgi:hypothetical protein